MERILDIATQKADKAEIFRIEKESSPACFNGGKLTSLEGESSIGTCLRVISNGRLGFSATTHPNESDELVKRALNSAKFGPEVDLDFPSEKKDFGQGDYFDGKVAQLSYQDLIDTGFKMGKIVTQSYPDVNLEVEVSKEKNRVTIMNSNGGSVSYEKTLYMAFLNVLMIMDKDRAELEHTYSSTQLSNGPQQIANDAVWRFSHARKVIPVETKKMTVMFTSLGFRGLFVPLFFGLNGDLVRRKLSRLSEEAGNQIVDSRITLYDDPTRNEMPNACPVDDEGVVSHRKILIEDGVLNSFFYDLISANKSNERSTGNGFKKSSLYTGFSVDTLPGPYPSNFIIEPGHTPREELIKNIDEGIIVDDTMGAGQGNNLNGEFSMNVALGYKIENGKIVGRIKDVMVAGNVFDIFKNNLLEMTSEQWIEDTLFGKYAVPWIAFKDMTVSAT